MLSVLLCILLCFGFSSVITSCPVLSSLSPLGHLYPPSLSSYFVLSIFLRRARVLIKQIVSPVFGSRHGRGLITFLEIFSSPLIPYVTASLLVKGSSCQ
jgi:hypothetical protein